MRLTESCWRCWHCRAFADDPSLLSMRCAPTTPRRRNACWSPAPTHGRNQATARRRCTGPCTTAMPSWSQRLHQGRRRRQCAQRLRLDAACRRRPCAAMPALIAAAAQGRRRRRIAQRRRPDGADDRGAHRQCRGGEAADRGAAPTSTRVEQLARPDRADVGGGAEPARRWCACCSSPARRSTSCRRCSDWERKVTAEPRPQNRPPGGFTALLLAAREGCVECAQALVEGGATSTSTDPEDITPLLMAILNAHFDTAKVLIEAGANVNRWDFWGRTPLYSAVDFNTMPRGGRPDRPSPDDTTPLDDRDDAAGARREPEHAAEAVPAVSVAGPGPRRRFTC